MEEVGFGCCPPPNLPPAPCSRPQGTDSVPCETRTTCLQGETIQPQPGRLFGIRMASLDNRQASCGAWFQDPALDPEQTAPKTLASVSDPREITDTHKPSNHDSSSDGPDPDTGTFLSSAPGLSRSAPTPLLAHHQQGTAGVTDNRHAADHRDVSPSRSLFVFQSVVKMEDWEFENSKDHGQEKDQQDGELGTDHMDKGQEAQCGTGVYDQDENSKDQGQEKDRHYGRKSEKKNYQRLDNDRELGTHRSDADAVESKFHKFLLDVESVGAPVCQPMLDQVRVYDTLVETPVMGTGHVTFSNLVKPDKETSNLRNVDKLDYKGPGDASNIMKANQERSNVEVQATTTTTTSQSTAVLSSWDGLVMQTVRQAKAHFSQVVTKAGEGEQMAADLKDKLEALWEGSEDKFVAAVRSIFSTAQDKPREESEMHARETGSKFCLAGTMATDKGGHAGNLFSFGLEKVAQMGNNKLEAMQTVCELLKNNRLTKDTFCDLYYNFQQASGVGHVMNKFRNLDYTGDLDYNGNLDGCNCSLHCLDTAQHMAELSTIFCPTTRIPEENSFYNFQTTANFLRTLTLHRALNKDSALFWDDDVSMTGKCVHTIPTVNMKSGGWDNSTGDEGETKEDPHLADSTHLADATHLPDSTHLADATHLVDATHLAVVTDVGLTVTEKAEMEVSEKLVTMETPMKQTLIVPDLHTDPDPTPVTVKVKARKRQKRRRQSICLKIGSRKPMRNVRQKTTGASCILSEQEHGVEHGPQFAAGKTTISDSKAADQVDTNTDGSPPPYSPLLLHREKAQTTENKTVDQMDTNTDSSHQLPPLHTAKAQTTDDKTVNQMDTSFDFISGCQSYAGCWDILLEQVDVRCVHIKVKRASDTSGGGNTGGQHSSSCDQSGGGSGGGSSPDWRGGARPKSLRSGDGGDDDDDEKRRLPSQFVSVMGGDAESEVRDKGQTTTPPRNYKRHRKKQHGAISNEQMCHCLGQAGMGIEMLRQSSGAGELDRCVALCLHDTSTVTSPTVEDLQCCCCAVLHSLLSHFASTTHPPTCAPCRQLVSLLHFHVLMCPDAGLASEEGGGGINVCHKMQVARLFDESTVTPDSSRVWVKVHKYLSVALGPILLVDCHVDVEDQREDIEMLPCNNTTTTTTTCNNSYGSDSTTALYSLNGVFPSPVSTISTSASATHSPAPSVPPAATPTPIVPTPATPTPAVPTPVTCAPQTPGTQTTAIMPKSTLTRRPSRRSLSIKTIPEEPASLPPSSLPTLSLPQHGRAATEPRLTDSARGGMDDPFSDTFPQLLSPGTPSGGEDIMKYIQDFAAKNPDQAGRRPSRPSSNPYDTQKIYGARDGTILSMPEPRARPHAYAEPLLSVEFKAKGVPGIGEVVYGTRKKLLEVVRTWRIERDECRATGRCRYQHHEEGVILAPFKQQLRILHTRYQKHQQWERLVHLGNGVTGKCHLCIDRTSNFKFCCKKMHILSYEDQELDIWSELSHPSVVCFYGAIRHGERIYMFAEFIDGGSLAVLIREQWAVGRRLSHWMALNYFRQILVTLTYLQSKGILHEDIKADNLLLREGTTEIILADFGVAQRICHDHAPRGRSPTGAPAHWAPEKASSEGHGFPSDLWAAACVLIHMLSGSPPWISRFPDAAILNFLIWSQPAPVDDIPPDVRESMRDLIACCLVKDVAIRPSAKQVLQHPAFQMLDQSGSLYSTFLPQLPGHEVGGASVPGHEVGGISVPGHEVIDASAASDLMPEQGAVGGMTVTPDSQGVFLHYDGNHTSGPASLPVISILPDNVERVRTVRTRSTDSAPASLQDWAVELSAGGRNTSRAESQVYPARRITTTPPTPLILHLTHREQGEGSQQQDWSGLEPYGAGSDSYTQFPVLVSPDIHPHTVPLTTCHPPHTSMGCRQKVAILPTPEGAQPVSSLQCPSPRVCPSPSVSVSLASADRTPTATVTGPHQLPLTLTPPAQTEDALTQTYPLYPDLSPEDVLLSAQRLALSVIPEVHEGEISWPTSTSVESGDLHAWDYYHDQLGGIPMDQGDITHFSPHSQGRPQLQLYDPGTALTCDPACGDRGQQPAPSSLPKLEEFLTSTSDSAAALYSQYKISSSEEEKTLTSGQARSHVGHHAEQGQQLQPPDFTPPGPLKCTPPEPSEFTALRSSEFTPPGPSEFAAPKSSEFTPPPPPLDVPDFPQSSSQRSDPACAGVVTGSEDEQISSGDLFGSGPEHCMEFRAVAEGRERTINVKSDNISAGHSVHPQDQLSPLSVGSSPVSPSLARRNPNLRLDVTMMADHSQHPASQVTDCRTRNDSNVGQRGRVVHRPRAPDTHTTPHTQPRAPDTHTTPHTQPTASSDGSFTWHTTPQDVSPLTPAPLSMGSTPTSRTRSSPRPGSGSSTPHSTYDRQEQEWHNLLQDNALGDLDMMVGEPASSMHHLSLNYQTVSPLVDQEESSMLSVLQDQIHTEGHRVEFLNHQGELLFDMRIRPCNQHWSELVGDFAPKIRAGGLRHYCLVHTDSGAPIEYFVPIEHTLTAVKVVEVSEDKFELCWCDIHQIHSA